MSTLRIRPRVAAFLAAALLPGAPVQAQHEHAAPAAVASAPVLGTVLCAEGPALSGAVVQLYHIEGRARHLMASGLTDGSGRFALRAAPGSYVLQVAYVGHTTIERPLTLSGGSVNLGPLAMGMEALQLDAIDVHAERERLQLRSGATVVDVARSAVAAGGSVADLLRTVPGLEIDAEGRITMRGSTSVMVLLNGRRMPLTEDALIAFLKQMPAASLQRIEAGTTASARQDADGTGGVVNLVLRDDAPTRAASYALSASAATRDHYNAAASANGVLGDAVAWDAMWSSSGMRPGTRSWTFREDRAGDELLTSEQDSRAVARHRLHSVMLGTTAHVAGGTSIGVRASFARMSGAYLNSTTFAHTDAGGSSASEDMSSDLEHVIPSTDLALTFDWRGAGPRRTVFTSEIRRSRVAEDFAGDYRADDGTTYLRTAMSSRLTGYVLQNDVSFDARGPRFELGQKTSLRGLGASYDVARGSATAVHAFNYDDAVHAFYGSAHRPFGTLHVQSGLRIEAERTDVTLGAEDAQSSAVRLFPSMLVQWPHGTGQRTRFRAAYSRRIARPESAMLNPYSMGEDDMNAFVGNPALRPELSHMIEMGVDREDGSTAVQITPFARFTRDPIRALKAMTESGRATTSLHNMRSARALGIDASIRARAGDRLVATLSGSAYDSETRGLSYRSNGAYVSGRAMIDVKVTDETTLTLYGWRRGEESIEQGYILPTASTSFALTHAFGAQHRGRVTVRVTDPFRQDRLRFHLEDSNFMQHSARRVSSGAASLFLSWSVGGSPREAAGPPPESRPQIF